MKSIPILIVLVLSSLLCAVAADKETKPKTQAVTQETFRVTVELKGHLIAAESSQIRMDLEEWKQLEIASCLAHGEDVKKGEPVIVFSTTAIDKAIMDLESGQALADLAISRMETDLAHVRTSQPLLLARYELARDRAHEDLKLFRSVIRPDYERQVKQSIADMENRLAYELEELRQLEKMYTDDQVTEETEEIILRRQRDAITRIKSALESMQKSADLTLKTRLPREESDLTTALETRELELAKAQHTLPLDLSKLEQDLARQKYARRKSDDRLAGLRRDRAAMTVPAPMAGLVRYGFSQGAGWQGGVSTQLRPGGKVPMNTPLITIVPSRAEGVVASVSQSDAVHLKPGQKAWAVATNQSNHLIAVTLTSINRLPDSSDKLLAEFALSKKSDLLPGMTCTITLVPVIEHKALLLPENVVFSDPESPAEHYVFLPEGETRHPVVIGLRDSKRVIIRKGLKAGDTVLEARPESASK